MRLDMFETGANYPFVYCVERERGDGLTEYGFSRDYMPVVESFDFDQIWRTIKIENSGKGFHRKMLAANKMFNEIARTTRRGCGNRLFVPTVEDRDEFQAQLKKYGVSDVCVYHDDSLAPNELRATYMRLQHFEDMATTPGRNDKFVLSSFDGGLQITPDGVRVLQRGFQNQDGCCAFDYTAYFVKGFL
jgi:hypothetical protein